MEKGFYRTAKKISEIKRDLQLSVEDCNNNTAPVIASNDYVYTFCANESKCITMTTDDADFGDTLELNAYIDHLPGATFISEKGKEKPRGAFCWRPTNGNVRSYPYSFVAEVLDDACPYPGRGNKTFTMYVRPAPAATYQITKLNNCGEFSFKAKADTAVKVVEYIWQGEAPFGDTPIYVKDSVFTYNYSEGGKYKITLTVISEDGCKAMYWDSVKVDKKVKVDLYTDVTICRNSVIDIPSWQYYGQAPFKYTWSTGDTGVTTLKYVLIDRDTFFVVNVVDANGCMTWDTMHLSIDTTRAGANANFTLDSIGVRTYKFIPADTTQGSYRWDFGDGTTSKDKFPQHTFKADSAHTVTLVTWDKNFECASKYKYTFPDPCDGSQAPKISALNNQLNYVFCAGKEKCIDFSTTDADTLDKVYLSWDNSLNNASLITDTSKRLATASFCWKPDTSMVSSQPHKITVYAFDNSSCQLIDSITVNVTVVAAPDAGFKADSVGIREFSFVPNFGTSVDYSWDFGDGSTSADKNPVHQYAKDSSYIVKLTIRNGYNCLYTDSMILNIELCSGSDTASTRPQGKIVKTMLNCHTITFEADIDSSIPVATYLWEGEVAFGDRPIWWKDSAFTYHYNEDGTYKIKLTMTSIYGCQTVVEDSVTIISPKNPFTIDSIGLRSYRFIPQDTVGTSFYWIFGDGSASSDNVPTHTFAKDSTYAVNLRWVKDGHCSDEDTIFLKVDICSGTSAPTVEIPNEQPLYYICVGQNSCLDLFASDADTADKVTFTWDNSISGASFFLDSSSWATTGKVKGQFCWTPSVADVQSQPYEFTVIATDSLCSFTTIKKIKVMVISPTAAFTIDSMSARTIGLSPTDTTYIHYLWEFGDGDTSIVKKPSHTYSADGTYNITLTVTDSLGCMNTSTQSYTITTSSINEKLNEAWKVYPNPIVGNILVVEAPAQFSGEVKIAIFDANGRRILEIDHVKEQKTILELPYNLQPGTYLVKINGDKIYSTEILVK